MIPALIWIVGLFLLICSIIDWKVKKIPSIFLTGMIFAVAVLNPANLWFGVMAFIMGYLLMEADFFSGVADLKMITIIGFMISSRNVLLTVIFGFYLFGLLWKVLIKWRLPNEKDVAFVPVFLFIYLTLLFTGGVA